MRIITFQVGSTFTYSWEGDPKTKFASRDDAEAHATLLTAQRNAIAGRELTRDELIYGVKHRDDRDFSQRQADEKFQVKLAVAESATERRLRLAREELRREDRGPLGMSREATAERTVKTLENQLRAEDEAAAREEELREFLNDPAIAAGLKELDRLAERFKWSDEVTAADVLAVQQARQYLLTPNADRAETRRRLKNVVRDNDEREQAKLGKAAATLAQQQALLDQRVATFEAAKSGDRAALNSLLADEPSAGQGDSFVDSVFQRAALAEQEKQKLNPGNLFAALKAEAQSDE